MEITGEKVINAPRDLVFAALHDPAAMRQAIPGCQRFAEIGENRYEAEIALKIGPIGGTFAGLVRVFNVDPPMGHSLNAEAAGTTGGGGVEGNAHVALAMVDTRTTNLAYHLSVRTSGQLAEIACELLDRKARILAAEFFSRLQLLLDNTAQAPLSEEFASVVPPVPTQNRRSPDLQPPAATAELVATTSNSSRPRELSTRADDESLMEDAAPQRVLNGPASLADTMTARERSVETTASPRRYVPLESIPRAGDGALWLSEQVAAADESDKKPALTKWFFVFVGAVVILLLLSDGY